MERMESMNKYSEVISGIKALDQEAMEKASKRLDSLIKPIGSLGKLEEIAIKLAGISGNINNNLAKRSMVIMCADNGIWEEGVSSAPQFFTALQTVNFTKGFCSINVLSRHANMDIKVIDIGVNADINNSDVLDKKVRKGTWNIAKGPAMTKEEAVKAIEVGIEVVEGLVRDGYQILGTGEMGICNTSTSSAVLMAFTGCSAEVAAGKGAGLTDEAFINKKKVLEKAIEVNKPNPEDAVEVLCKVGGLDIAGLVGCYLGAAYYRVPIIIDGFISAAAALTAYRLNPLAKEYMIASHCSAEPGYKLLMEELGLNPLLELDMRVGEGTGCPLALNIIDAASKIITEMATFEEATVQNDFLVDIR
jgi:nicotinate-nucleotide--dimethylbenzimidazole phosphoribosyltransferase